MSEEIRDSGEEPVVAHPQRKDLESVALTRFRRLRQNFSLSLVNKVVTSLRAWLINPFLILCLGPEDFGVWTALASINALDQMMDLGMGNSLVNAVATARGRGEEGRVGVLASLVLRKLSMVTLVVASLLAGLSLVLDPSRVFVFIRPENGPAHLALLVILGTLVLSTPLSVVEKVEAGYQRFHYIWVSQIVANLTTLSIFGFCWLRHLRPGMAAIALIVIGPFFLARIVNWIVFFGFLAPHLRPRREYFSSGVDLEWERVNRTGWMFFILQWSYLLCFSADYMIVGNVVGGSAVGAFACVSTYTAAAGILPTLLIQPLWPAYNEAAAANDYAWCSRVFRRVTLSALGLAVCGCLGLQFLKGFLLPRFAPGIPISQAILLAAFAGVVLESLKFSLNTLLNGFDQLRFLVITHVIFFVLATPFKVLALRTNDLVSFLWLRTILTLLLLVAPAGWLAWRIFRENARGRQGS
ncbi:hypothetical protein JST97_26020 [bacterium]|nr:hypothetical protein [bacterium]